MHAFLVIGNTYEGRLKKAHDIANKMDAIIEVALTPDKLAHSIASIRNLVQNLKLKASTTRCVILIDANKLTIEASNAFLKTLEEPPQKTIIILTAANSEGVLETIRSRCEIVDLGTNVAEWTLEEKENHNKTFTRLVEMGVGERFAFADMFNDREKAEEFLISQLYVARDEFLKNPLLIKNVERIDNLTQTLKDVRLNVNIKLTLTNLLLDY